MMRRHAISLDYNPAFTVGRLPQSGVSHMLNQNNTTRARDMDHHPNEDALIGPTLPPMAMNRRNFLGVGATLLGGLWAERVFPETADQAALPPKAWRDLELRLQGRLLRPGQAGFASLALPNNLRYASILPEAIAICANAGDIAQCLRWCADHGMPLAARGGGHSYAGYSCTSGLMINLSAINQVGYDKASGRVTVGGGARNGALYSALQAMGRSVTHGRCPTVGAGGFLLGGGIGFDMRANGVGSDKLVSTEVVLADGSLVTASATQNPDLFWACRGGAGGNFGINTAFTLDTFAIDRIVVFSIQWSMVSDDFIATLFQTLEAAPRGLGSRVGLAPGLDAASGARGINVNLLGQFNGSVDELRDILQPVFLMATPTDQIIDRMHYWTGQSYIVDPEGASHYQERSRFVNGGLPEAAIPVIRAWLRRWNLAEGSGLIKFFQTGGAVNDPSADASAFVHRSSQWLASIGIQWQGDQSAAEQQWMHRWQDGFYREITPLAGGGAFQNFVDPSLENWETAYYGTNLPRLRKIKARFDPANLFRFPQSIPPARA